MRNITEEITYLARLLGTAEGVKKVSVEIDRLSARLLDEGPGLSCDELCRINEAVASLSRAIVQMNRISLAMLSELGVRACYVG